VLQNILDMFLRNLKNRTRSISIQVIQNVRG